MTNASVVSFFELSAVLSYFQKILALLRRHPEGTATGCLFNSDFVFKSSSWSKQSHSCICCCLLLEASPPEAGPLTPCPGRVAEAGCSYEAPTHAGVGRLSHGQCCFLYSCLPLAFSHFPSEQECVIEVTPKMMLVFRES